MILIAVLLYSEIQTQNIPERWQSLYDYLGPKLKSIDSTLDVVWNGEKYCMDYCTNLLPANSAQGPALFEQMPELYSVNKHLDALDSMGITTIDLAIQYPTLVDSFPRSAEYLEYYKLVFEEIREREMDIIVGCQATIRDTVYGNMPVDSFYIGLTPERYMAEKLQMLQTIIDHLYPDYLTIEMEPQTQADNLPLDFSLESVMNYVSYFLSGLDKNGVLIGAGSGSWDDLAFIDSIAKLTDIDYIDFHIYPINQDFFVDKVFKIDSIADHYNKILVIGESWLFKATDEDLMDTTLAPPDIFYRDVFSFWIPLDSLFLTSVVKLSQHTKSELTSLMWSNLFFAYIDHIPAHDSMWPGQLLSLAWTAAGPNILSHTLSPTGELYKQLISDACDTIGSGYVCNSSFPDNLISYPNPFSEMFTIEIGDPDIKSFNAIIYNTNGQIIRKINCINGDKININGADFTAGLYFVQLYDNYGVLGRGKVVKMN